MEATPKKNKKWIIFGSIVLILAVLIAVGPILITKYMRSKWQNGPKYQTSNLMMKVDGKLQISKDNIPYLAGNNGSFYVLENLKENNIQENINKDCSVFGKMRIPKEGDTIDGKSVRLFIGVEKINAKNISGNKEISKDVSDKIKEKSQKKGKIRIEVNAVLNKPILFDVTKGKVSVENRKALDGKDISVFVLTDEFGDRFVLFDKKMRLKNIDGVDVVCLGREILPPANMPLVIDEVTFEIYEMYDSKYNKLI
ncbi:MAG: hypothetical protein PHG84_06065 [Endomicrobiaceae bacterium]|nr:hypothetical protein [Endomicrobiaceae bacterium]MDD3053945.1 hypothetical protein [Endomicrobiaceae bacterium]